MTKALLPRLFGNVDLAAVGRASLLAPADVSILADPPVVIAFRLGDLPDELTALAPPDAGPRNCLFWMTRSGEATKGLFSDLPEPTIDHVEEAMQLCVALSETVGRTHRLAKVLPPAGSAIHGGFHTGEAEDVERWFRDKNVLLLPVRELIDHLYFLKVEGPDGQPLAHLEETSLTVNVNLRYKLDEVLPGIFVVEADKAHEHFKLLAGNRELELTADDLQAGQVTTVRFGI